MVVRQEVEAVEEVVTEGDAKVVLQTRLFFSNKLVYQLHNLIIVG